MVDAQAHLYAHLAIDDELKIFVRKQRIQRK
jgi:hypothetical protein